MRAMTRYLIPPILVALIAALLVSLKPEPPNSGVHQANEQRQSPHASTEFTTPETTTGNVSRTKSKNRIQHPKPTYEETMILLGSTIIPKVDFQDQSLSEVTAALNTFIKDAGISPHKLKVVINNPKLFAQWKIRELRVREIPLAILLKFICDSTTLRYRVEPGIIRCFHSTENIDDLPHFEKPNIPDEPPPDPNDPFSGPPYQGIDPFAEPGSTDQSPIPLPEP